MAKKQHEIKTFTDINKDISEKKTTKKIYIHTKISEQHN